METSGVLNYKDTLTGPSDLSLRYFEFVNDQIGYRVFSLDTTFNPGRDFIVIEERLEALKEVFKDIAKRVIERNKEILIELAKY